MTRIPTKNFFRTDLDQLDIEETYHKSCYKEFFVSTNQSESTVSSNEKFYISLKNYIHERPGQLQFSFNEICSHFSDIAPKWSWYVKQKLVSLFSFEIYCHEFDGDLIITVRNLS